MKNEESAYIGPFAEETECVEWGMNSLGETQHENSKIISLHNPEEQFDN